MKTIEDVLSYMEQRCERHKEYEKDLRAKTRADGIDRTADCEAHMSRAALLEETVAEIRKEMRHVSRSN